MNQKVTPYVSEVAKILAGVPAGCVREDEEVRQRHAVGSRTRHPPQMVVPMERGRSGRAVGAERNSRGVGAVSLNLFLSAQRVQKTSCFSKSYTLDNPMARRTQVLPTSEPPSITPQRAIELIQERLKIYEDIIKLHRQHPNVRKWESTTEGILNAALGKPNGDPHPMTKAFMYAMSSFQMGREDAYYERLHQEEMVRKKATLESVVEQLQILAPPIAQVAPGTYQFHAEIERVAGHLFRDGHYKQAALEAYIRVIDEVKVRSGLPLDGDTLMNQAFGCDGGRFPVLKFNELLTDADKDEQRGFMYLFNGIVGHRNLKAHSNRLFNDPLRAHEYLSLASLLMRVLELVTK
jgi:uncharacterized protein (TIGR02391 family)